MAQPLPACESSRRIYLAAAFVRHPEMQTIARELSERGHMVVSSWIWESDDLTDARGRRGGRAKRAAAIRNLRELQSADLCIVFATPAGQRENGRGGRHVELGAALALDIETMLVGPEEHLFHTMVTARFQVWGACRDALGSAPQQLAA